MNTSRPASRGDERLQWVLSQLERELLRSYLETGAPHGFSREGWLQWLDEQQESDAGSHFISGIRDTVRDA